MAESRDIPPLDYRWIRGYGLRAVPPWYFEDDREFQEHWRKQYADRFQKHIWLFAQRQDREEVCAFEFDEANHRWSVIVIDWGWDSKENRIHFGVNERYPTFMAWLNVALEETRRWMDEENLRQETESSANEPESTKSS
jgi:hypothetical protein